MTTSYDTLEMGPCLVSFKGTDLGLTQGGVDVTFATDVSPINADQFGDSVVNQIIKGRSVKVKVPMAERDLTKLAAVFPAATLVGTTTKKLVVNAGVGTSLRALAGELILHPKDRAADDLTADVTIPLAQAKGDIQFSFKHDTQRVYAVEFEGYVDLDADTLFILGDPAASGS